MGAGTGVAILRQVAVQNGVNRHPSSAFGSAEVAELAGGDMQVQYTDLGEFTAGYQMGESQVGNYLRRSNDIIVIPRLNFCRVVQNSIG